MRIESIVVDENIEAKLEQEEIESHNKIYDGVGMWGSRALDYIFSDVPLFTLQIELEERGDEEAMNAYAKMIDRKAQELREVMEEKLLALPEYKMTEDFLSNVQKHNEINHIIEEQIYADLIYVEQLVQ